MPLQLPPGLTPPRQATPRNFDRPTYGGHAAAIAAALGRPYIPVQRYAADVALEIDPANGQFWYDLVIVTMQRQVGKTVWDQSLHVQNCTMGPNRRTWYTAQTGAHATKKFLEMMEVWDTSDLLRPMARKPRRSNGSARLHFHNGSEFAPYAPTAEGLHGEQVDRDTLDEAWAFSADQGAALRQAAGATKLTRRMTTGQRPQTYIISTEGTIESGYFNALLDAARAGELGPRTCLLDWGLRDDDDPMDLDVVASRHPGFGHLFEMEELVSFRDGEFKDSPGEFARAFGNRRTGAAERVIPAEPWKAAAWNDPLPQGVVCFGAAAGIDGVDAAITVSQIVGDQVVTSIVDGGAQPGTWWVIDRLKHLTDKFDTWAAIDKYGPSAGLHDDATRAGIPLLDINSGFVSTASQQLLAKIKHPDGPKWRYRPHAALEAAAALATRRYFGDGAWAFGRRASVGSIASIEAGSLSSHGIYHLPEKMALQLG